MSSAESESSLIARLLALPPAEQAALLRQACAEREGLRDRLRQVAAALADCESGGPSSSVSLTDDERARALALALTPTEDTPASIGPYKLLEKIGEGGFGLVWMAEQQHPVRRRVAVKIIKGGMDTREVIARFEAERQALALMEHPNIARVFDAGETADGRPFVVMELVRGLPITSYCNEHRLSTEARLQLFATVSQAVQHAHQKGIIHRDLKPSNILVTLHDGVPVPKIIDFGIAKATGAPLTQRTLFTRFHAFIGTPAYTSPEQIEMSGLDVDTRSDIYSLGILLYELLAGHPPFDPDQLLQAGLEEMRRTIREVEPPRPSHRVRTLSQELRTSVAQQRSVDPARLSLLLRGDLDWIVMHCLEKDRTRRYATAHDLADDLRRFLAHEPVNARPPSTAYRLAKFTRRHRLGVTAGALVALAVMAGTVISTLALLRESAARQRAQALHAEASKAAARSEQIAGFMKHMLAGVDPNVARGRDTTLLREILDTQAPKIDVELRDHPEVAADLRSTLASVYTSIGDFGTAEKLLRQSIAVFRAAQPPCPADLATALNRLGLALKYSGRQGDAKAAFQEAVTLRERIHGRRHLLTAEALYNLSKVVGDPKQFRALREEVFGIYSELLPPGSGELGDAIFGLGSVTCSEGDWNNGIKLFRQALDIRTRARGPNDPSVSEALQSVGLAEVNLGHRDQALLRFREALDIRRRTLGDAHPEVVSTLLRLAGVTAAAQADPSVVEITDKIVAAQRAALPRSAPGLAFALLVRASFAEFREHAPESAARLRADAKEHLSVALRDGIPIEPRLQGDLQVFADFKSTGGAMFEAIAMHDALIAVYRAQPPSAERTQGLRDSLWYCAMSDYWLGRFLEANLAFAECLNPPPVPASPHDVRPQISLSLRSDSLLQTDRIEEGWALLEPYCSTLDTAPPPPKAEATGTICTVKYQIGRYALRRGDLALAETAFQRAREGAGLMLQPFRGPGKLAYPPERFDSALGLVRARLGRLDEAEALCRTALTRMEAQLSSATRPPPHVVDELRANLAEVLRLAGDSASRNSSPRTGASPASGTAP